ncbi:MAG: hypothetical protein FWD96_01020 [Defluviitaleaceae bacterium]|nr:hypothetical protein [Defluviitaleaceae bacterium]
MEIRVLLASEDARYVTRLAEVMARTPGDLGEALEISLFTEKDKLAAALRVKSTDSVRFDVALVDEDMADLVKETTQHLLLFTEDSTKDAVPHTKLTTATCVYKYQRVQDVVRKMLATLISGGAAASVCAFISPVGGSGTSTVSAAFANAVASTGSTPLYISFECFNTTELFFSDTDNSDQGLSDVFCVIAQGGGVTAAIDTAKATDGHGVTFLKKFASWVEPALVGAAQMDAFIDAARISSGTNVIVLDLGCGFPHFTQSILRRMDHIFVVAGNDVVSQSKLKILFDNKLPLMREHLRKTHIILNKCAQDRTEAAGKFNCASLTYIPVISAETAADIADTASVHLRELAHKTRKE